MKIFKISLILIVVTVFVSATSTTSFAGPSSDSIVFAQNDTSQTKTVSYEVFGMDCPGCQSALEKQVEKIEGVEQAKASFKEKVVVLELKSGAEVSDEEIEQRIKKANFTPGKKLETEKNEE